MTRIIAGSARGRRLSVPAAGTRPTTDRVRESMFNILAARIDFDGLIVLDLFAGSGALGLEALSRGAESVTFVEADAKAAKIIEANVRALGLSGVRVIRRRAAEHLERSGGTYDLVLADPPYDCLKMRLRTWFGSSRTGRSPTGDWSCWSALLARPTPGGRRSSMTS